MYQLKLQHTTWLFCPFEKKKKMKETENCYESCRHPGKTQPSSRRLSWIFLSCSEWFCWMSGRKKNATLLHFLRQNLATKICSEVATTKISCTLLVVESNCLHSFQGINLSWPIKLRVQAMLSGFGKMPSAGLILRQQLWRIFLEYSSFRV